MRFFVLFWLILTIVPQITQGDNFTYLQPDNGLSDGEINAISQDSTGNMWFATWSGLIKYDGYNFELFRPVIGDSTSLPDKKIKSILVDKFDNLWVVSTKISLYQKELNTFRTFQFEGIDQLNFSILQINEIDSNLIINTTSGFFILPINDLNDKDLKLKKIIVKDNNGQVSDFYYLSYAFNNTIVMCRRYPSEPTYLKFAEIKRTGNDTFLYIKNVEIFQQRINDIYYLSSENTLFLAASNGLISYSLSENGTVIHFKNENIEKVIYTGDHYIYAACSNPELKFLDLHTGKTGKYLPDSFHSGALLNSNILSLYVDFSGNLWVGHRGQGISILNLNKKEFTTFRREVNDRYSLNSNTIMCFNQSEDEVIIGCRTGGLNFISKNDLEVGKPKFLSLDISPELFVDAGSDGIWDIQRQTDSLFWIGTSVGLFQLIKTPGFWRLKKFKGIPFINEVVRKIYLDENNNIWCGTHSGGLIFIPNIKENTEGRNFRYVVVPDDSTSLSDNVIISILKDSRQRFWIGTQNGLNLLNRDYENLDLSGRTKPALHFKRFFATNALKPYLNNNEINDIKENFDGKIWISTQGGGINIYDPENEGFEYINIENGLPSNDVQGCLPDDGGNIWISTAKGLVKYCWYEKKSKFKIFDHSDGIQGDIFMVNSFFKSPDGQMFFGGDNGFTCFYPQKIQMNIIPPKIEFSHLIVKNYIVDVGDTLDNGFILKNVLNNTSRIVLSYDNNSFSVGASSIHYQDPTKNSILYILDGYNDKWQTIPATFKSIDLVNLPYGEYTLKVKALSSDNIESKETKKLNIVISPPWYFTRYAVFFFLVTGFSFLLALIFFVINREKLVYQRKIDEMTIKNNENKLTFLTNIAHDLRTPLSLVLAPIDDLIKNFPRENKYWEEHFQLIARNSNYLLRLINQILDFNKLNEGKLNLNLQKEDIVQVVNDIFLSFKGYENSRNVQLLLDVPKRSIIVPIDIQKIEEILYNLLSNAFKNTPDNHSIIIKLELIKKQNSVGNNIVRISVFNEGKEISDENLSKIFDRFFKIGELDEGSGIGLSFAKSLAEMQDGTIRAESVKGKGMLFIVDFPFSQIEIVDKKESAYLLSTKEYGKIQVSDISLRNEKGEKRKILIVEDNVDLLSFLKDIFSRYYNCIVATNGQLALDLLKKHNPELVISDVRMNDIDGFTLTKAIKENLETCHIPVILLTANSKIEQIKSGYEVGADAYLTKPFDVNLLLTQANRLIKNRDLIREKYKKQNFMVEVDSYVSKDEDFVMTIRKYLEENITDPEFNVNQLSKLLNISTTQLYRRLKSLTGYSPVEFIRIIKLQKAYELLNQKNHTVKEVCYLTGFNNLSYFIKCFRIQFGITPANFRDSGPINKM